MIPYAFGQSHPPAPNIANANIANANIANVHDNIVTAG